MLTKSDKEKLLKNSLASFQLTSELKSSAIDSALKEIKSLLLKHKTLQLVALKGEKT